MKDLTHILKGGPLLASWALNKPSKLYEQIVLDLKVYSLVVVQHFSRTHEVQTFLILIRRTVFG